MDDLIIAANEIAEYIETHPREMLWYNAPLYLGFRIPGFNPSRWFNPGEKSLSGIELLIFLALVMAVENQGKVAEYEHQL